MNRREFINSVMIGGSLCAAPSFYSCEVNQSKDGSPLCIDSNSGELGADLVVVGGGLGGCATALAALRNGLTVVMTEETDWIGGQLTQQLVPPDEHPWIETHGAPASYRELRRLVRDYYRNHYPLKEEERKDMFLNPGKGSVSRLCAEPKVWLHVLEDLFVPYISAGRLVLLLEHKVVSAEMEGHKIISVMVRNSRTRNRRILRAPYFVDATELGDLLDRNQKRIRENGMPEKFQIRPMSKPSRCVWLWIMSQVRIGQ